MIISAFKNLNGIWNDIIFFVFSGLIIIDYTVRIILSAQKNDGEKHQAKYYIDGIILSFSYGAINLFLSLLNGKIIYLAYVFLLCGITAFLGITFNFSARGKSSKKQIKKVILPDIIKRIKEKNLCDEFQDGGYSDNALKITCRQKESSPSIDVSHVKSILERVEKCSLSPLEKRQVSDLKDAITLLEHNAGDNSQRERINDGLNYLLKIMAKYGV